MSWIKEITSHHNEIEMIDEKEIAKLSKSLFWDVPQDSANIQRIVNHNSEWLIQRAFEYGAMRVAFIW